MMNKKQSRLRRATKLRRKIRELEINRLTIFKTPKHMYAHITSANGSKTIVHASTLDKALSANLKVTGNVNAAAEVGKLIAERALKAGIDKVAFDRAGFLYHGRVKALAEAAREAGLNF